MSKPRGIQVRTQSRRRSLIAITGVIGALLPVVLFAAAPSANATAPDSVSFTQEGCRNNGGITLPNGSGDFICADSAYTTGNLGKNWSELDLVPFRLTAKAGTSAPASQTYTMAVVLDAIDAGHPGFDVLSAPVLNTTLSDASCTAATAGPQSLLTPGLGGTDTSM